MTDPVLDRLLVAAARRDRGADEVWPAAAAAIELLWWLDRFGEAGELAETTLRDLAAAPGLLFSQDVPFDEAILLGAAAAGDDPGAALARALAIVPAETVLGKSLSWSAAKLPGSEPHSLVRGGAPAKPAKPLRERDQALADRDPSILSDPEQSRLWKAAHSAGQYEVALRLLDAGGAPTRWFIATWLAQHLVEAGDVTRASALLVAVLPDWIPYQAWDIVPTGIVLQPGLRPAVTAEVRAAVFEQMDIDKIPGVGT
ncbi:MAG: hypothetical protein JWQ81_2692 [Amycolatopsis sp.]|uniref:hypothetical protein n=1 Tax=Amycolatopsis sp. TaxID=37632 RepID=UPI0026062B1F|nr:hypothetical protein [Amycolatopsis sp.]MCU1681953.1 hypothetical protein [Amycolatopsis sp.]